jgi:ABC-type lipoprotein release transport system permease subunit
MKLALQLAYRNLIGAGLRTWLNVGVLSFSFIVILFYNGLIDGWNKQALRDTVEWEYGYGHLLNEEFDPLDPFTLTDGHSDISKLNTEHLTPILLQQGSIYPEGRMVSGLLKGVDPNQEILKIPTKELLNSEAEIPIMLGKYMAKSAGLRVGENVLLRWRDSEGTFDAADVTVVHIFDCDVPTVDGGQIYMDINQLWKLTGLNNHATMFVAGENYVASETKGWKFKTQDDLLSTLNAMIDSKKYSGSILYILLMAIALLAIFDTQVLSIFRRQKEIGTYIALGMTRAQVVRLFTVEGFMYSLLAMIVGSIYGIPLLFWVAKTGIPYPVEQVQDFGVAMSDTMFPVFGIGLILSTVILVVISATIVSYLPARKISKMDPVDAIKGKLQ